MHRGPDLSLRATLGWSSGRPSRLAEPGCKCVLRYDDVSMEQRPPIRVAQQGLRLVATLLGAACVGVAIPAAWFWVGAQIQGSTGARPAAFLGIAVTIVGIIACYVAVVLIAGRVAAVRNPSGVRRRQPRWASSHRGERHSPPTLNSLEQVFANAAILIGVAFIVWVLLFPTNSLPPPGGP